MHLGEGLLRSSQQYFIAYVTDHGDVVGSKPLQLVVRDDSLINKISCIFIIKCMQRAQVYLRYAQIPN